MKFLAPTWDAIYIQSIRLATQLRKSDNWPFDVIVGVSRGGLAITRIMSDLLDIQKVLVTRCEYYSDVGERNERPVITQKIQCSIRGKNVLLIDDVSDTGESLIEIKKYLVSKRPNSVTVATIHIKPWSKLIPDYYVSKTDAWIIYPWELYEAIKSLTAKQGMSILAKTGMPSKYVRMILEMDKSLVQHAKNDSAHVSKKDQK